MNGVYNLYDAEELMIMYNISSISLGPYYHIQLRQITIRYKLECILRNYSVKGTNKVHLFDERNTEKESIIYEKSVIIPLIIVLRFRSTIHSMADDS